MASNGTARFAQVAVLLEQAAASRVFPGATLEIGTREGPVFRHACGTLSYEAGAAPATVETLFDLASLTKVVATTSVIMRLVDQRRVALDEPVAGWFSAWRSQDRLAVTVADLLEHAAGLTAYLPFFRDHVGRADFEHAICTLPLEYVPRTQSIYSDLGFILLAFLAVDAAHGVSLDSQFDELAHDLRLGDLRFRPPAEWLARTAPTEFDPWRGRLIRGEVHDENGWALGGVAGHTGLFGSVPAVGRFARALLETLAGLPLLAGSATLARFLRRSTVPGSSRALGWDTMRVTSSCGRRLSPDAFGHTGFTGTSLWIDPAQDLYVALLTNRVHPTRDNAAILKFRPALHDAVVEAIAP